MGKFSVLVGLKEILKKTFLLSLLCIFYLRHSAPWGIQVDSFLPLLGHTFNCIDYTNCISCKLSLFICEDDKPWKSLTQSIPQLWTDRKWWPWPKAFIFTISNAMHSVALCFQVVGCLVALITVLSGLNPMLASETVSCRGTWSKRIILS